MRFSVITSLFRAEWFKLRSGKGVLLLMVVPLVVILMASAYLIFKSNAVGEALTVNPWTGLLGRYVFMFYALLSPLIMAIFCHSVCETEYKHKCLKLLFTLPVSKLELHAAKIMSIISFILLAICLIFIVFVAVGYITGVIAPVYGFASYPVLDVVAKYFLQTFIASLSVAFIQYTIGLVFDNFVIPIGVAGFFVITSIVAARWEYIDYVPYHSFFRSFLNFVNDRGTIIGKIEIINIMYVVLFIVASYFVFRGKKV